VGVVVQGGRWAGTGEDVDVEDDDENGQSEYLTGRYAAGQDTGQGSRQTWGRQGPPRSIRQGRHGTQVTIPDGIKSS
jgi:hypothetical protein